MGAIALDGAGETYGMAGWALALAARVAAPLALGLFVATGVATTQAVQASSETPQPSTGQSWPDGGQEVTLSALGLPAQTAAGQHSALEFAFPPPAGPIAGSGSFVRVFFSHTPLVDPSASTLTVAVNDQPLTTIRIDESTAQGAVFELRVPAENLRADRINRLETRFDLKMTGVPSPGAVYARVDSRTLIHYQLFGVPGTPLSPRLEGYPYPLLRSEGRIGLILPGSASDRDLQSALRLAGDLGRRSAGEAVRPEVVTGDAAGWLRSAGVPALLIGQVGRLPQAADVLRAAGFQQSRAWTGPSNEPVGDADGIVAAATSPWDGHNQVVLVSGLSDDAVARAADALVEPGRPPLSGAYAIVRPAPRAPAPLPVAGTKLPLRGLDDGLEVRGPGSRSLALGFSAPPVDPAGSAALGLTVSWGRLPSAGSALWARLNGVLVDSERLAGDRRDWFLRLPVAGSLLRPGLNSLTLGLDLAGSTDGWAHVSGAADLTLPAPPARGSLELLPDPLFRDPGGVLVALGSHAAPVVSAAASALAALGGRTTFLPALEVGDAATLEARRLARGAVIAVGVGDSTGALGRLAQRRMVRPLDGEGIVEERLLFGSASHLVLWIDGASPDVLALPAAALARHPLPGVAISVDGAGRVRALDDEDVPLAGDPLPLVLARVLIVAASAGVALLLTWQVVWPRGAGG